MLGQAISLDGYKYNVIILAGGEGSRMGGQSEYIPKALSQIGNKRAIDYLIERYIPVAHKFIIGICKHADLLQSYIEGRFKPIPIEFSREDTLHNNAISLMFCLDHADIRYGTIVLFCDLLTIGNPVIEPDSVLVATKDTHGVIGTFRHYVVNINGEDVLDTGQDGFPLGVDCDKRGILGYFVFQQTKLLKSIVYSQRFPSDLTYDFLFDYMGKTHVKFIPATTVYEFGNSNDLEEVRKKWEDA
jgi:choline kinase